jgi:hypothetical protein
VSGFFFIKKKDRKYRPVQDYRNLNKYTVPNKYPLPLISELIHELSGRQLFSKFNIQWGYNNICIKEGDKWKAAFKTSKGLYKPTVMFFRLTNSPATFQTMMDDIFQEEVAQGWLKIYMDDAIVATEDNAQLHQQKVDQFLTKLQKNDLFLKPEKCQFHKKEVEYLGVIIGGGKVCMDPVKVECIAKWAEPRTVRDICSFLGFCNFYRAFIPHFSDIARPLNDLTKKNYIWNWGTKEQEAFDTLKQACTAYPVLRTPDWKQLFIMETDTSGFALGVVIAQEFEDGIHPIAYHARSLAPAEKNYNTHDKELAGVIYRFKCGCLFFLGAKHPICVRTDHKNLQYFCEPQKIMGRQARWIQFLQDFDYTLEHILGPTNTIADLLSRRKDLNKGMDSDTPHILLPNYLFAHKMFLKDDEEERCKVLWQIHDSPTGGHPGIANTWDLVTRQYKGPRLRQFIEDYVKGCACCQESKTTVARTKAPLQHFNTHPAEGPFQYISMDLITDLPKSDRYNAILTIVDQGCSKAAKFLPCHKTIDRPGVAHEYLKHLVPWFGTPRHIISDRDPRFASNFSQTICKVLGIQQNLSTVFHPRTDGQTERMNAWVEQYLCLWTSGKQDNWAKLLPIAEFAHNSWKHEVTQKTPHKLLIGCNPVVHVNQVEDTTPAAIDRLKIMEEAQQEAQTRLDKLHEYYGKKQILKMKVDDLVWLEGKNLQVTGQRKLLPCRYKPFAITARIRNVAYKLALPPSMKIHDVFHVDLLLPYKEMASYGALYTRPALIIEAGEEEYKIEAIRDARQHGQGKKLQYLIHWKGYPNSDNSWVDHKDLHAPELLKEYYSNSAEAGRPDV